MDHENPDVDLAQRLRAGDDRAAAEVFARFAHRLTRLAEQHLSRKLAARVDGEEARAAATLHHPNICPVHEVGVHDGVPYLTMDFVEGQPLADLLAGGKPVPQRQAAALVRKLALALQEAHAKGVVHRDLKPSNVMINQRKEPVIMDFGLARRDSAGEARLTKVGAILGTPAYMSPEQVCGDVNAIGPGCDVYALGVILYELLAGRLPFEGPAMAVLAQILTQPPEPPSAHRPDLDPRLEVICLKALAKQPQDRYPHHGRAGGGPDRVPSSFPAAGRRGGWRVEGGGRRNTPAPSTLHPPPALVAACRGGAGSLPPPSLCSSWAAS
jgi:serine/threonine protein kinase